jgi:hypothetical protein
VQRLSAARLSHGRSVRNRTPQTLPPLGLWPRAQQNAASASHLSPSAPVFVATPPSLPLFPSSAVLSLIHNHLSLIHNHLSLPLVPDPSTLPSVGPRAPQGLAGGAADSERCEAPLALRETDDERHASVGADGDKDGGRQNTDTGTAADEDTTHKLIQRTGFELSLAQRKGLLGRLQLPFHIMPSLLLAPAHHHTETNARSAGPQNRHQPLLCALNGEGPRLHYRQQTLCPGGPGE